jgi:hypothetical protein
MRFTVGFDLTEPVRAAILQLPDSTWVSALDQDGAERANGQVAELTGLVDLSLWPAGSRLICRRERARPGAQLSFTDHDGHRFQVFLTDQDEEDIAVLERRQRQRARVEDHIRNDKDTGLSKLPFQDFHMNQVWLCLVLIAHDLIAWAKALLLEGELARTEPKRLRYRLFAHRRAPGLPRPPRASSPATQLALGGRARRRIRQAPSAAGACRLICKLRREVERASRPRAPPSMPAGGRTTTPQAPRSFTRRLRPRAPRPPTPNPLRRPPQHGNYTVTARSGLAI